jgi:hypothetical protein
MKYIIMIYNDEQAWESAGPDDFAATMAAHRAFNRRVPELGGTILGGDALESSQMATSIRGDIVTDGPFVESKEAIGGFYLIDAATPELAREIATLCPSPRGGVELRPIWETSSL